MPLKSETVDWIFARMLVRYGASWVAKWNGVPMEAVAADWAHELERVPRDSILYALGYLPLEFPPTVAQFKAICQRAPEPKVLAIRDEVKADKAKVDAIVGTLKERLAARHRLQWAHDLAAREKRGEPLTPVQAAAWREALNKVPMSNGGLYTPIDPKCLPPAMRPATETTMEWDHAEA